ncbi:hypothetical protein [Microbulbifer sp. TYP-18]|uniref:hypothetical protein n=1 Tax=Microbulbifer sp. TYP-18 TaxID=3230024 RepID=UPI0034C69338
MQFLLVLFVATLLSLPVSAQEQTSGDTAGQQQAEQQPKQQTKQQSERKPGQQETIPAQARNSESSTQSDADDYRATEEISEDLSVSYPVDI